MGRWPTLQWTVRAPTPHPTCTPRLSPPTLPPPPLLPPCSYGGALADNRLVGSVQIRQVRVAPTTCPAAAELFGPSGEAPPGARAAAAYDAQSAVANATGGYVCWPLFDGDNGDTAPFGRDGRYKWREFDSSLLRSLVFSPHLLNIEMTFGTGGYAVELPPDNATAAMETLLQLEEDFVDLGTRGLAFSFSFYNPPLDMFTVVQVLFDMSPTRYIEKTARVRTLRLLPLDDRGFLAMVWRELPAVVLAIFLVVHITLECGRASDVGLRRHLFNFWNMLDVIQFSMLVAFLTLRIVYHVQSTSAWQRANECALGSCFVDLQPVAWFARHMYNVAAVSALLSMFKVRVCVGLEVVCMTV